MVLLADVRVEAAEEVVAVAEDGVGDRAGHQVVVERTVARRVRQVLQVAERDGAEPAEDEDELEEERRLCYVGLTRARERLILTSASRRRVFGDYQSTEPSRFLDESPAELMRRIEPVVAPSWNTTRYETRNPYARRYGQQKAKEEPTPFASYENEDQSSSHGLKTGKRVRHKQFGVGTVIAVGDEGDDMRVTVKFNTVGTKKLLARYAALEPA